MSLAGTDSLLQIAKVLKSNGTAGELIFGFREYVPEDISITEPVFIYFDGLPVPFFISSYQIKGNRAYVTLNDIHTLEDAEEIAGKGVFVDYSFEEEDEDGITSVIGWTLTDAEGEIIGKIVDYEDIPGNPCLYVETKDGQAMVPFHEELILSVDYDKEFLSMELPEGLFS